MSKFIHKSVRLNTSITQAMRFFLIKKEVDKWLGDVCLIENKKGGIYHLTFTHGKKCWESKTEILEKDFERFIKLGMEIPEEFSLGFENSLIEISFMQGTSKTEYCTEIHILHKGLKDNEEGMNAKKFFEVFWEEKLNIIRKYFNGDWVIEDRDLVLSVLKGGF